MLIRNLNFLFLDTFALIKLGFRTLKNLLPFDELVLILLRHTHHFIFILAVLLRIHYRSAVLQTTSSRIQVWFEMGRVHFRHLFDLPPFSPGQVLAQSLVRSHCCSNSLFLTAQLLFSDFAIPFPIEIGLVLH